MYKYFVIERNKETDKIIKTYYLTSKTWAYKFFKEHKYILTPQKRFLITLEIIEENNGAFKVLEKWEVTK